MLHVQFTLEEAELIYAGTEPQPSVSAAAGLHGQHKARSVAPLWRCGGIHLM